MKFVLPIGIPELYEDLHRHPELANREERTAGVCSARLERSGFTLHRDLGGAGVLAEMQRGAGPTILLRAELDALPLAEKTGASFSSETADMMHACGHDLHLAAVIAAAEQLAVATSDWSGKLAVLLQPAEEAGTGAQAMIEDGLAKLLPRPDALLAQHVSGLAPVGVLASTPGVALAASDTFRIRVYGGGGHSSTPDRDHNAVLVSARLAVRLSGVVGEDIAPFEQAVLTVPGLVAPATPGLRAPYAEMIVNTRSFDPLVGNRLAKRIEELVHAEAGASGLSVGQNGAVQLTREVTVPRVHNDSHLLHVVATAHRNALSLKHLTVPPALASDDVATLAEALGCPSAYWFVGSGAPGDSLGAVRPGCHTDRFLPSPGTLAVATAAMRAAAVAAFRAAAGSASDAA